MTNNIKNLIAREVLDSRGNPTVSVEAILEDNTSHIAIVPSGASTGKKEALELRDGGDRYFGKGVLKACDNVNNTIAKKLIGINAYNQAVVDNLLKEIDGTDNYANIGANAALGVSMAIAGVSAKAKNIPLYKYLGGAML